MAMVRNDTMIKKMRGNIATLEKKNDTIQAKADKEKEANIATIAVLQETIAKFEALEPKLPLPEPEAKQGEELPLIDAIEEAKKADESEAEKSEEQQEEEKEPVEAEEQEEEEKRPARKSGGRKR